MSLKQHLLDRFKVVMCCDSIMSFNSDSGIGLTSDLVKRTAKHNLVSHDIFVRERLGPRLFEKTLALYCFENFEAF